MKYLIKRQFRFSTRFFFIVIVLVALITAKIYWVRQRVFAEQKLILLSVSFDPDVNGTNVFSSVGQQEPTETQPLRGLRIGREFDYSKKYLSFAKDLEVLELSDANLDLSDLSTLLPCLVKLRLLSIRDCHFRCDKPTRLFSNSLKELEIRECDLSDEVERFVLFDMPKLASLDLGYSKVVSLQSFVSCLDLRAIYLTSDGNTRVVDSELREFPKLEICLLNGTPRPIKK